MKGNNQVIDVNKFFSAVIRQKKDELRPFFADDAVIRWHCTNEKFTPDEYFAADGQAPDWRLGMNIGEKIK